MAPHFQMKWFIAVLVGLLLASLFAAAGVWQLSRAEEKRALQSAAEAALQREPEPMLRYEARPRFSPAILSGRPNFDRAVLLENQLRDGERGYHAFVPVDPAGGGPLVLMNLGWRAHDQAPVWPERQTEWEGRLSALPRPGIELGEWVPDGQWPARTPYLKREVIESLLQRPVAPQVLLLTQPSEDWHRQWQVRTLPPERHQGYAFQWFSLSLLALGLTVWFGSRRWRRSNA